jgi:hypothetical protein
MIIDDIFNTNALRLPLFVIVGVSNLKAIFPLAFSYCLFESEDAFRFFFNFIKELVFLKGAKIVNKVNISLLKVVFND